MCRDAQVAAQSNSRSCSTIECRARELTGTAKILVVGENQSSVIERDCPPVHKPPIPAHCTRIDDHTRIILDHNTRTRQVRGSINTEHLELYPRAHTKSAPDFAALIGHTADSGRATPRTLIDQASVPTDSGQPLTQSTEMSTFVSRRRGGWYGRGSISRSSMLARVRSALAEIRLLPRIGITAGISRSTDLLSLLERSFGPFCLGRAR